MKIRQWIRRHILRKNDNTDLKRALALVFALYFFTDIFDNDYAPPLPVRMSNNGG